MTFEAINTADTDSPMNQFDFEEDGVENNETDWTATGCCDYGFWSQTGAPTLEDE